MTHRARFVALVVVAVVLAGCSGFAPGGDKTSTVTVTPAAVPTDQPTSMPAQKLAPGLTRHGVTEPFALGRAHAVVLGNTSYTVHNEQTIRYANGTLYRRLGFDLRLAANETRYGVAANISGGPIIGQNVSREAWSNGERVLRRRTSNQTTSYSVPRDRNGGAVPPGDLERDVRFFGFDPTKADAIETLFGAVETHVVGETTRNGTTLYEVAATNMTRKSEFETGEVNHPRNLSLRALVSPQGLVREYRLDYTATLRNDPVPPLKGETVRVHRAVRYTDLGNTTIERPPWYDAAMKNVSTTAPTTAG